MYSLTIVSTRRGAKKWLKKLQLTASVESAVTH